MAGRSWSRSRNVSALAASALVLCLAPAPTSAASGWTPPALLAPAAGTAAQSETVVQSLHYTERPNGDAIAVWGGWHGAVSFLSAAVKRAGATSWPSPQKLSGGSRSAVYPSIAVAASGRTLALWSSSSRPGAPLHWSLMRPADRRFGVVRSLSVPAGSESLVPFLAATRDGGFVAMWEASDLQSQTVVVATLAPGNERWSAPRVLSGALQVPSPQALGTGTDGSIYAAWSDPQGMYVSRLGTGGGDWSPPQYLASPFPGTTQFAVGADGTVALVWDSERLYAAVQRPGSVGFSDPQAIGASAEFASILNGYGVAVAADGDVTTIWTDPTDTRILAADLPVGASSWTDDPPLRLSTGTSVQPVALAARENGTVVAVWSKQKAGHWLVQSATRPTVTRQWSTAVTIAARPAATTSLSLDAAGDTVIAAWLDSEPYAAVWSGR